MAEEGHEVRKKTAKYMKHAFCGLIHNFTCMNSNLCFHVPGKFVRPLSNRITVFAGASFHVRFTCQPVGPTSKAASQPAQSVQPASQQASQPAQPASHPASHPAKQPAEPAQPAAFKRRPKEYIQTVLCAVHVSDMFILRSLAAATDYLLR